MKYYRNKYHIYKIEYNNQWSWYSLGDEAQGGKVWRKGLYRWNEHEFTKPLKEISEKEAYIEVL